MFHLAKKLCACAKHKQHYHAAIVVKGGAVVSTAYNYNENHAEMNALKKLWPDKRRGVVVYSMRFTKGGKWGIAKPCKRCEKFMKECGVKKVFYTDVNGELTSIRY